MKTDDYISRYEVTDMEISEQIHICEKLDKLQRIAYLLFMYVCVYLLYKWRRKLMINY